MVTRFGNLLRTKREQLGLSLQDVVHKTRIPVASLIALEEEDYDAVGSHVYSSGFLRLYCTFLGLDAAAAPEHWRARPPADTVLMRWGLWGGPTGMSRSRPGDLTAASRPPFAASPAAALTAMFLLALVGAGVWGNHVSQEWAAMQRQEASGQTETAQTPGPFSTQPPAMGTAEQPVIVKAIPVEEPGFDQLFTDRTGNRRLVE